MWHTSFNLVYPSHWLDTSKIDVYVNTFRHMVHSFLPCVSFPLPAIEFKLLVFLPKTDFIISVASASFCICYRRIRYNTINVAYWRSFWNNERKFVNRWNLWHAKPQYHKSLNWTNKPTYISKCGTRTHNGTGRVRDTPGFDCVCATSRLLFSITSIEK